MLFLLVVVVCFKQTCYFPLVHVLKCYKCNKLQCSRVCVTNKVKKEKFYEEGFCCD